MDKLIAVAEKLNGCEYGDEICYYDREELKRDGIVVVYGGSDDLMYLDGAMRDEIGCYDGGTAYVKKDGLINEPSCSCHYAEEWYQNQISQCKEIKAVWCDGDGPCWTYETDIPHVEFDVMEDGEVYCRGIVFSVSDL